MKKLILIFAFLLLPFDLALAQTWLMVPKSVTKDRGGTTHVRPDISGLPISVARTMGKPVGNADCPITLKVSGCYLIQVAEDFSKVGPTAKSNWTKPTPTAVTNALAAQGIDVTKVPPMPVTVTPDIIKGSLLKLWNWIQPTLVWAASCAPCDDFVRTSSYPLNGSWTNYQFSTPPAPTGYLELAYGSTILGKNPYAYSEYSALSWSADQEVSVLAVVYNPCTPAFNCFFGPIARSDGGATGFYAMLVDSDDHYSEIDIFDIVGTFCGTPFCTQTIGQDLVTAWASNDVIKLQVVGSSLTGYKNGSSIITTPPDTSFTTGRPGIIGYDGYGDRQQGLIGPFSAADVGGAPPSVVRHVPIIQ